MYKVVKKSRAIQSVILILTLAAMMSIYPIRMWSETIPSVSNQKVAGATEGIIGDSYLLQRFIAQYDHLGTINIYLADFEKGWFKDQEVHNFIFRLMDSDMEIMFEELVDVRFVEKPGLCPIYVNEPLTVGRDYYIFLQGNEGSTAWFGLEKTAEAGTEYVSRLITNYDELEGYNIIAEYNYQVPLRKQTVAVYDAILLLISLVLIGIIELFYRKFGKDKLITVKTAAQTTGNCLIASGTILAFIAIGPLKMFDFRWSDNLFYLLGVLLLSVFLLYVINRKGDRFSYQPVGEWFRQKGGHFMQALFVAGAIQACCAYMNGLYDIHHRIAERQFMSYFALIIISMSSAKRIFNRVSALYAVVASAALVWFYGTNYTEIQDGDLGLAAFRYGLVAAFFCGFAVLLILRLLIRKKRFSRISIPFASVLGLFFLLAIIFNNGRSWMIALVISFLVFYLRYSLWDKKEYLLQNISTGIAIHFMCALAFSLLQRPFLSWIYPRFPFIFHTVTVTAVYLMVVTCAAFLLLAEKCRKSAKLKDMWKEVFLTGASGTYLLFTASRTGFLSAAVILILILLFTFPGKGRERATAALRYLGIVIVSVIWCFPIIFTAQRILPAVNNSIFRYEVETFPDAITRGNEWNSMYYINVERFFEVFNNKVFGIPEKGSSSYERSPEYQEYRARRFNAKGEVVWEGNVADLYVKQEETPDQPQADNELAADQTTTDQQATGQNAQDQPGQDLNIISNKSEEELAIEKQLAEEANAKANAVTDEEEEDAVIEDTSVYEATEQYANGRFDIFKAYVSQLNLNGHEEMGAPLPDGSTAVHAHNIYLQVAYDHGIIVGILFLAVGVFTFVQGCLYYRKKKELVSCAAFPMVYTAGFAVAGMVEWIFHLCNPAGFMLLLLLAPLLFDMSEKKDKLDEKGI